MDFFFVLGNVAKMAGAASLDLGVQMPSASGHGWLPHVFLFVAFFLFPEKRRGPLITFLSIILFAFAPEVARME